MKTLKTTLIFGVTLFALLFIACEKENNDGCTPEEDLNCICTMEYNPVCGCDNVTYSNPCHAACAKIENYTTGPCSN